MLSQFSEAKKTNWRIQLAFGSVNTWTVFRNNCHDRRWKILVINNVRVVYSQWYFIRNSDQRISQCHLFKSNAKLLPYVTSITFATTVHRCALLESTENDAAVVQHLWAHTKCISFRQQKLTFDVRHPFRYLSNLRNRVLSNARQRYSTFAFINILGKVFRKKS